MDLLSQACIQVREPEGAPMERGSEFLERDCRVPFFNIRQV